MVAIIESRSPDETATSADAVDVVDLLKEFLSHMPDNALPAVANSEEEEAEVVLCSIVHSGIRYTLSCRPCPVENETQSTLSPREKEIVRLVMKGLSTRGISQLLEISPWTVSTHMRRIFLKLGVKSRAEMVAQVLQEGVLTRVIS